MLPLQFASCTFARPAVTIKVAAIFESRLEALAGVRLAVASVARHAPDLPIVVSVPHAPPSLAEWLSGYECVQLMDERDLGDTGWDVKPLLLLRRLETADEVIWLDSDVVAAGPLPRNLTHADEKSLVVAQEHHWGRNQADHTRTRAWKLTPGRRLATSVNTAVVRVTASHRQILEAWHNCLMTPEYRHAKDMPYEQRPMHLKGDQDVLDALLSSERFSDIPVVMIRRGSQIAQCHGPAGYTPFERIRSLANGTMPPFVHAQAYKPWDRAPVNATQVRLRQRLWRGWKELHLDVSPYTVVARGYADELGGNTRWLAPRTALGKGLQRLSDDPIIQGLPIAVIDAAVKWARRKLALPPLRGLD